MIPTKRAGASVAVVLTDRAYALDGQTIGGRLLDFSSALDALPLEFTDPAGGV